MDEVERFLTDTRPDESSVAVDGAWVKFDRLRRQESRPGRSRRAWFVGLTSAGLVGAVVAGGSVAAAANGTAPVPVSQALTAAGVLRPAPTPAATAQSPQAEVQGLLTGQLEGHGVLLRYGTAADGKPVPFMVFGLPDTVTAMSLVSPDGASTALAAATGLGPRIFLGQATRDHHGMIATDSELVGSDAAGREVVRISLADAELAYTTLLKTAAEEAQSTP